MSRIGGKIQFQIDGEIYDAKGSFTYNLGGWSRDAVIGEDGIHGFSETARVARIEGEITDMGNLNLDFLQNIDDAVVTLTLFKGTQANPQDKVIALDHAWYAGTGDGNSKEGNVAVLFHAKRGREIT